MYSFLLRLFQSQEKELARLAGLMMVAMAQLPPNPSPEELLVVRQLSLALEQATLSKIRV